MIKVGVIVRGVLDLGLIKDLKMKFRMWIRDFLIGLFGDCGIRVGIVKV